MGTSTRVTALLCTLILLSSLGYANGQPQSESALRGKVGSRCVVEFRSGVTIRGGDPISSLTGTLIGLDREAILVEVYGASGKKEYWIPYDVIFRIVFETNK